MKSLHIYVTPTGPKGRFRVRLGEDTYGPFRTPFYSMARVLKKQGVSDNTMLYMHHENDSKWALRNKVGVAATLSIKETSSGPIVVPYRPFEKE